MATAYLLAGLGFGDEGKGTVTDALARREGASLIVRFNGGGNAGHHVVLPDGRSHCFSQFGSGTLAGARTHLSRFTMVNPVTMLREAAHLAKMEIKDPLSLVTIDREALITTPLHVAMNRLRELSRGEARHGSCGMGIGETMAQAIEHPPDTIRFGDLGDFVTLHGKLERLQERLYFEARPVLCEILREYRHGLTSRVPSLLVDLANNSQEALADMLAPMRKLAQSVLAVGSDWIPKAMKDTTTIFEGAQGVLLDETWGFQPHTTWSHCTFANAEEFLRDFTGDVKRYGITRAFMTRHGAGPFPTENPNWAPAVAHDHNKSGPWQGDFRVGPLDLPLLRYAIEHVGGKLDGLCVTNLDRLETLYRICGGKHVSMCLRYKQDRVPSMTLEGIVPVYGVLRCTNPLEAAETITECLGETLVMMSTGPTYREKQWVTST